MTGTQETGTQESAEAVATRRARIVLLVSIVVTALLYVVPYGRLLAWPMVLISTLFHELGHGLAAILVGGDFEMLQLWGDGSGVATWAARPGRLRLAAVAAGGLVGPAMVAAFCLVLGRRARGARICLLLLGIALVIAELLVVRSLFGLVVVGLLASGLLVVAARGPGWLAQTGLVFLAVQLSLSVFSRADYLFMRQAETAVGTMPSDVARIAEALVLPYWFWGICCGLVSIAVLLIAMVIYLRR